MEDNSHEKYNLSFYYQTKLPQQGMSEELKKFYWKTWIREIDKILKTPEKKKAKTVRQMW